jgi:hypothetical protein
VTNEELQALRQQAAETRNRAYDLELAVKREEDRRALEMSKYKPGDEVEVGGTRQLWCITRVRSGWGEPRYDGRRVLKDGTLGKNLSTIYRPIMSKVGHRDLETTP